MPTTDRGMRGSTNSMADDSIMYFYKNTENE